MEATRGTISFVRPGLTTYRQNTSEARRGVEELRHHTGLNAEPEYGKRTTSSIRALFSSGPSGRHSKPWEKVLSKSSVYRRLKYSSSIADTVATTFSAPTLIEISAVAFRDPTQCETIWKAGQDLSMRNAIQNNNVQEVRNPLQHYILALNSDGEGGITYLQRALQHRANDAIIALLIDAGTDVPNSLLSLPSTDGRRGPSLYTYLHIALLSKAALETVRLLIEAGVDVHTPFSIEHGHYPGYSPLYAAVRQRNHELVQLLTDAGTDVHEPYPGWKLLNPLESSPLQYTVMAEDAKMARVLINAGVDVNVPFSAKNTYYPGCSPLHIAIMDNKGILCRVLIVAGADVNIPLPERYSAEHGCVTALQLALHEGNLDPVAMLLERNADYRVCYPSNNVHAKRTVLQAALVDDASTIVRLILEEGADPQTRFPLEDPRHPNRTLLQAAALDGHPATVRVLIEAGADPHTAFPKDSTKYSGCTPLQALVLNSSSDESLFSRTAEAAGILAEAGVDIHVPYPAGNHYGGMSPLQAAILGRNHRIVQSLLTAGADVAAAIPEDAGFYCGLTLIQAILAACVMFLDLKKVNDRVEPNPVQFGEIMEALIDAGADVQTGNFK